MRKVNDRLTSLIGASSPLGFGGWALGGEYWGPQEHKDSVRAIHRALHMGINHFDTAPVYGKGRSEQLLGQQLKKIRNRCLIGTKAFYTDPSKMVKSLETSLKRLLTDYVDIFYIHWPQSGTDMRPGMEALEKLRREGRIRAIGVSNFSVSQIRMVQEAGTVDVYQGGYSVLWPFIEEEILPFCRNQNIAFIPYGVLAQGLLTDKGAEKIQSRHEGFRNRMILYRPEFRETLHPFLEKIREKCREQNWSVEQAASQYVMEKTDAYSILMGTRNKIQADMNFRPIPSPLPPSLRDLLEESGRKITGFLPKASNMFDHES